jgi:leader peptidase (prepilin peptidase)/N-methyltransferase
MPCKTCKKNIPLTYPFTEIITALLLTYICLYIPPLYAFGYFVFFSALIVISKSDIETMLISQHATLHTAPLAFLLSWCGMLSISLLSSITGAIFGYASLYIFNAVFKYFRGYNGMGEGDFDLLFLIGAFTGIIGCWATITIGSMIGSIVGIINIAYLRLSTTNTDASLTTKIPFGPFLALGAILYVMLQKQLCFLFLC